MPINKLAENCVLEIGEVVGNRDFVTTTQTGNTNIYEYLGCKDNPGYKDEGFNSIGLSQERVFYRGITPNQNSQLGGTIQEAIGIGNTGTQGCVLTYLVMWSGNYQIDPGTNIDDNKVLYITLYKNNNYDPVGIQSGNIPPYGITSSHFVPYNGQGQSNNVQGRSLYYKHNQKTIGLLNSVTQREGVVFDVISASGGDDILLKGNGSDTMDDYSIISPDFWSAPEDYSWYISAYMHSHNWDSSEGTDKPFYWIGGRCNVKTEVGSYEGSQYRNPGTIKMNECYRSTGLLGLRSDYFGDMIGNVDCFKIEIQISEIENATLTVLEGTPNNTNINSLPNQNLTFDSVGVYTVCLSALKRSAVWNDTASYGGLIKMNNNRVFDFADGSVNLLDAQAIHPKLPARITLDYIKIIKQDPDFNITVLPTINTVVNYSIEQYNYNYLNIFDSEALPLSLTYSIGNVKDLSKRATGYSKTFQIPADQHNVQVLEPLLAVGAVRTKIDWQPCRIKVEGIIVFKGLIRIEEGVSGGGGAFSCHIIEDSIDWTNLLSDTLICDIAVVEDDVSKQKKNMDNIVMSWNNSPNSLEQQQSTNIPAKPTNFDKDYHWGLVNYGEWQAQSVNIDPDNPDYRHNASDFHPAIFAYSLIHKIFSYIGYTLESNFIESETFKKLCHPYSSGTSYIEDNLFGEGGTQFTKAARAVKTTAAGTFFSGGRCPDGFDCFDYPNLVLGSDLGNNWTGNTPTGGYLVPFSGDYNIQVLGTLYIKMNNFLNTSNSYVAGQIMINGQISTANGVTSGFSGSGIVHHSDSGASSGVTGHGQVQLYTLNAGDRVSFRFFGHNDAHTYDFWADYSAMSMSIYPVLSATVPEYSFNLSKVLPCTKQLDYLKGLTELFNLQWTADKEAKTVQVEPYDEFYGSGKTVDWTNKLDRESWTDTYIVKELAQSVRFQYKEDATDKGIAKLAEWREQNSLDVYKSYTEINEARFRKETLELGTKVFNSTYRFNNYGRQPYPSQNSNTHPVAPNAYRWGDLSWTDPVVARKNPLMPVMWSAEGGRINGTYANRPEYNPRPKFGLRILNYYGERNCSSWVSVDENGNNNIQTSYPYMDWFDGWSKSIDIDPYNLSWDDVDDGYGNNSPGLFTKYWRNAYEKMNGGAMLRTCKIALTPVDINLFDYKDKIHLKIDGVSTYWTVQKIKDYKPNKKELTEVELIEWKHDTSWESKSTSSKRIQSRVEEQETYDVSLEQQVKSSIEYGITNNEREKAIQDLAQVGLTVDKNGEIQMYGGELVVENTDGSISNLVYTEDTDVRKLYLQKEEEIEELVDGYLNTTPPSNSNNNNIC